MQKVIEVANKLGVSKVTIYKKISALKSEIKPYIVKEKNITYLKDEAVKLISDSLALNSTKVQFVNTEKNLKEIDDLRDKLESTQKDLDYQIKLNISELESSINYYREEIELKKDELNNKNSLITMIKENISYNKERISRLEKLLINE